MKALLGERGAYRLAQPVETVQVPPTVQAILASRIDRLPPEEKRLLETAAVIGKDFPFSLLQAIANESEETLRRGLSHLQAAEFLYEMSLFPDLEYTFKHALTHDVAYGSVLHERRRAGHAQIVDALERLYPDRLTEHVELLGHHAFRGERWEKAVKYLRQAGLKAAERSAHRDAVAFLEQTLKALEQVSDGSDNLHLAVDLRIDLRNSLYGLGEYKRTFRYLKEADELAGAIGDKERSCRVAYLLAHYFWVTADHDRAVEMGEKAHNIARNLATGALEWMSRYYVSLAYHGRGDYPRAEDNLSAVVASLEGDRLTRPPGSLLLPSVVSRFFLVWSLAERGQFTQGLKSSGEAVEIAEQSGRPGELIHAYMAQGFTHLRMGEALLARQWLERALVVSETADLPFYLPWIASTLGYAHALCHEGTEARINLTTGVERAISMNVMTYHPLWLSYFSEAHLLAGRIEDAQGFAERALRLSRTQKEHGSEAWALRVVGAVAAHRDPPHAEQAAKHYNEAVALGTELGMRPLVAHCHLGLGRLYRRAGREDQAREHLTRATTMYGEMDMRFWREHADADLLELR